MSTKIYYAYRIPKGKWLTVVDALRDTAKAKAKATIGEDITRLLASPDLRARVATEMKQDPEKLTAFYVDMYLHQEFRKQITDSRRSSWDYSASAALRFHGNWVYLIPYCGDAVYEIWDFLKKDPLAQGCEEYGYWNNSDQPENVTGQEWGRRRKLWDHLTSEKRWSNFLVLDILTPENWDYVTPAWDLEFKERDTKKETTV